MDNTKTFEIDNLILLIYDIKEESCKINITNYNNNKSYSNKEVELKTITTSSIIAALNGEKYFNYTIEYASLSMDLIISVTHPHTKIITEKIIIHDDVNDIMSENNIKMIKMEKKFAKTIENDDLKERIDEIENNTKEQVDKIKNNIKEQIEKLDCAIKDVKKFTIDFKEDINNTIINIKKSIISDKPNNVHVQRDKIPRTITTELYDSSFKKTMKIKITLSIFMGNYSAGDGNVTVIDINDKAYKIYWSSYSSTNTFIKIIKSDKLCLKTTCNYGIMDVCYSIEFV